MSIPELRTPFPSHGSSERFLKCMITALPENDDRFSGWAMMSPAAGKSDRSYDE